MLYLNFVRVCKTLFRNDDELKHHEKALLLRVCGVLGEGGGGEVGG